MMNWTPFFEGNQTTPFGGPNAEKQPEARRVLSDISNTPRHAGFGLQGGAEAQKRPILDPQTPARRTTAFEVFEDTTDVSAARNAASPPYVRPKSRGAAAEDDMLDGGIDGGILGIEEVDAQAMEADLPGIDRFIDPVGVQDQYWGAFGMSGPDGFGSSERLLSTLGRCAAKVCHEANAQDAARWRQMNSSLDDLSPGDMSPGEPVAWPTPATPSQAQHNVSPFSDRRCPISEGCFGGAGPSIGADGFGACGDFGFAHQVKTTFSPLSPPRLPAVDLDVDMDGAFSTPPSAAEPFGGLQRLAPLGQPPPS